MVSCLFGVAWIYRVKALGANCVWQGVAECLYCLHQWLSVMSNCPRNLSTPTTQWLLLCSTGDPMFWMIENMFFLIIQTIFLIIFLSLTHQKTIEKTKKHLKTPKNNKKNLEIPSRNSTGWSPVVLHPPSFAPAATGPRRASWRPWPTTSTVRPPCPRRPRSAAVRGHGPRSRWRLEAERWR